MRRPVHPPQAGVQPGVRTGTRYERAKQYELRGGVHVMLRGCCSTILQRRRCAWYHKGSNETLGSATAQTKRGEPSLLPPFPQMLLCQKARPTRHAVLFNAVHGRRFHMLDQDFTVSGSLVSFKTASSWCPWCCFGFISSLTSRSHAATCQGTSVHVCQRQRH